MLQSTAMGKHEPVTLSLDFPEGASNPEVSDTRKNLRASIFKVIGQLDMNERRLPVSMETVAKISVFFDGSQFILKRNGDEFSIEKREIREPVQAVANGQLELPDDNDREEPDYCNHFRNGEWGKFSESTDGAVKLATRINAPKKDGSAPKWRAWFDRNKRVFQYRGEELRLIDRDGKEVDEKTLRAWMRKVNKKRRNQKRRADLSLPEDQSW